MKKFTKISALICAAAMALGLGSCTREVLDTNQYSDTEVTLASYGPNPVVRGGALSFYGSNLQNVKEVIIPGCDAITDIEVVESGKISQIRINTPVEGPEIGKVILKTKEGKTLSTKNELTYTEGIVFESFELPGFNAYPGDVVVLKGDYMHLVHHVNFPGGTSMPVLEGSTRHEAKVIVPANAIEGKLILSDGAEVEGLFYSEEDFTIGTPEIAGLKGTQDVKVGQSFTFTGKHMEMFNYFEFADGVVVDNFAIEEGYNITKVIVDVPAEAVDGPVTAYTYDGISFYATEIHCIMPTEVSVVNEVKAGEELVLIGNDLDVVTKVDLDGAEDVDFTLHAGQWEITVPATAKSKGTVKLYHSNGQFVEAPYTLVTPKITAITPSELFAGDEPVVVSGTDLDLIVKAYIGGKECAILDATEEKLVLETSITSVGGKVTLVLANGEEIVSEQEVVMNYHSKVIVAERPDAQHIGELVSLKGTNMDLVETIYVGSEKVTKYAQRTPEEIDFIMPYNKVGSYELKFVLYDGDEEIQASPIEVLLEREFTVFFEGAAEVDWNEVAVLSADQVASLSLGQELYIYYDVKENPDYTQIRMIGAGWSFNPEGNATYQISPSEAGVFVVAVDQALKDNFAGGISLTGHACIINKVETVREIPQEITIWEGSHAPGGWGPGMTTLSWGGYDWSQVSVGTELIIHYLIDPAKEYDAVMRAGNGSWVALPSWKQLPGADAEGNVPITEDGELSITLTADDLNELVSNGGLVVCGAWFIVTSVGLL